MKTGFCIHKYIGLYLRAWLYLLWTVYNNCNKSPNNFEMLPLQQSRCLVLIKYCTKDVLEEKRAERMRKEAKVLLLSYVKLFYYAVADQIIIMVHMQIIRSEDGVACYERVRVHLIRVLVITSWPVILLSACVYVSCYRWPYNVLWT